MNRQGVVVKDWSEATHLNRKAACTPTRRKTSADYCFISTGMPQPILNEVVVAGLVDDIKWATIMQGWMETTIFHADDLGCALDEH